MNIHYLNCTMPRLSREEVQNKILAALVEEVAINGIGAVAVASVAKRAGVAPGTIYIHFASKEDLLQKVYLKLNHELHRKIILAKDTPDKAKMVRQMWFNLFDFVAANPFGFLFLDYAGVAQVLTAEQAEQTAYMQQEIDTMLAEAIRVGVLADLPISTIITLLVAPALYLARYRLLRGEVITQDELEVTFERVWLSISRSSALNN